MTFESEQQSADALEVLKGTKPAVIIELRKAPATYAFYRKLLELPYGETVSAGVSGAWITRHEGAEGHEIVIATDRDWFAAYIDLLNNRHDYSRPEFHTAFGYLLGYSAEDIAEYVKSPADCECSKCGGPYADSYKQTDHGRYYDPNPRALKGAAGIQSWSNAYAPQAEVAAENETVVEDDGLADRLAAIDWDAQDDDNVGVYLSRGDWLVVRLALIGENCRMGSDRAGELVEQIRNQVWS
jgi:hypothetical protein